MTKERLRAIGIAAYSTTAENGQGLQVVGGNARIDAGAERGFRLFAGVAKNLPRFLGCGGPFCGRFLPPDSHGPRVSFSAM